MAVVEAWIELVKLVTTYLEAAIVVSSTKLSMPSEDRNLVITTRNSFPFIEHAYNDNPLLILS